VHWTGTLVNRTVTFVRPFLVLFLTGSEHVRSTKPWASSLRSKSDIAFRYQLESGRA